MKYFLKKSLKICKTLRQPPPPPLLHTSCTLPKTSFPKELIEKEDLDKPVLNKIMTTRD